MASVSYNRKISFLTRFRYLGEAAGIYFLYGLFALMPVEVSSWISGKIARTLFPHFAASRKAMRNLEFAMPELTDQEKRDIVRDMWENLGRVFGEYPHLGRLSSRIHLTGAEHLVRSQGSDTPSIMVGGHFANWEVYAATAQTENVGLHLVYRKSNNYFIDGLLQYSRRKAGALSAIPKTIEGARQMMAVLKNGETLGALIDQKFNEGIAVPFFGHDAMTAPAIIQMAIRLNVPVYPARIRRTKGARFDVTVYPALDVPKDGSREEKTYYMLCRLHEMFEEWIREEPAQWLWIHRRWKKKNN